MPLRRAPSDLVRLIGSIAISGQALELYVTTLLAQTLQLDSLAMAAAVAGRLGVGPSLDIIQSLSLDPAIQAWVPKARHAIEARNQAIHEPWFEMPAEHQYGVLRRNPLRRVLRAPTELRETSARLVEVLDEAEPLLTGRYPLPPLT